MIEDLQDQIEVGLPNKKNLVYRALGLVTQQYFDFEIYSISFGLSLNELGISSNEG